MVSSTALPILHLPPLTHAVAHTLLLQPSFALHPHHMSGPACRRLGMHHAQPPTLSFLITSCLMPPSTHTHCPVSIFTHVCVRVCVWPKQDFMVLFFFTVNESALRVSNTPSFKLPNVSLWQDQKVLHKPLSAYTRTDSQMYIKRERESMKVEKIRDPGVCNHICPDECYAAAISKVAVCIFITAHSLSVRRIFFRLQNLIISFTHKSTCSLFSSCFPHLQLLSVCSLFFKRKDEAKRTGAFFLFCCCLCHYP